jgi:hypothetical protein
MNQSTGKSDNEEIYKTLFKYDISNVFGKEYVDVFHDISRMLVIQFTIQLLMYMTFSEHNHFFTSEFLIMCIYIVLGVMVYWLIFKKVITFT